MDILKSNGVEITDSNYKLKADVLNAQYTGVFACEDPILPTLGHSDILDIPGTMIALNGAIKHLGKINPTKATGPNLIPARILKGATPTEASS